jgi:predicted ATPase
VHARPVVCPSLIGRDRELALLHASRRALAQSHASLVLIGGEAGIGKSRLLAQFLRGAGDNRRLRAIVCAECFEHAPQPFGPVRDVITELARVTNSPLPPTLARFVARETNGETLEKAELFAFLRERARDRATIVAIEDLHWSDATTIEFLGYLAARITGTRLLVIATYRSEMSEANGALSAAIARAMREPATFHVELSALKAPQLRELLCGALEGHSQLDRDILDEIVERADGNPFFGEELLKSALERSEMTSRSGLPISIRASVIDRLRAFSPDERLTIDRAAVLGTHFDPELLARIRGVSVERILSALRRARDANIVVEEDGARIRFHFRHALTRQAVYDNLLLYDARRTHRLILETLESFNTENELIEELAFTPGKRASSRKRGATTSGPAIAHRRYSPYPKRACVTNVRS